MWKIRPFMLQDQPIARQLILDGLGGHFGFIDETMNPDLDDIWQQYIANGDLFVVVESDGVLVGTGALVKEGGDGINGRLVRMSVHASHQRQGIGRRLVRHLCQKARECGYTQLFVETNNDWFDAIGLYESCGFREYARDIESVYLRKKLEPEE